jgi:AcrR family transcriptional regulator
MMRSDATAWLDEGLKVLAELGASAVTLDRMCERMGLTKGAFYHHFGSMPAFREQLLTQFEAERTTAIIDIVERAPNRSARDRLEQLLLEVTRDGNPRLEIALRAWANQDQAAAKAMRRVDATRIGYVRRLCAEAGHREPKQLATLLYVVLIGADHVQPPLPRAEKRAMYDRLAPLLDVSP